jgi:hypothetical protein
MRTRWSPMRYSRPAPTARSCFTRRLRLGTMMSPSCAIRSPVRSTGSSRAASRGTVTTIRLICSPPNKPKPSPGYPRATVHRSRGPPAAAPRFSMATPCTPTASSTKRTATDSNGCASCSRSALRRGSQRDRGRHDGDGQARPEPRRWASGRLRPAYSRIFCQRSAGPSIRGSHSPHRPAASSGTAR